MRTFRESRGLSIAQVSKHIGIDPSNLSRIERGKQTPSLPLLIRIAQFYNCGLDDLIGKTKPAPKGAGRVYA